jgi:superfamily I DNA/RNA helicase
MAPRLTAEQDRLADHFKGPGLGIAVAGSGKTECQIERLNRLIRRHGVPARAILMTTFAKRGTADMRRRGAARGVPVGVDFRTLHSVALQIIRQAPTRRKPEVPAPYMVSRVIKNELKRQEAQGEDRLPKVGDVLKEIGLAKAALIWPMIEGGVEGEWIAAGNCARCSNTRKVTVVRSHTSTADNADVMEFSEEIKCPACVFPCYREWAVNREREPIEPALARIVDACYREVELMVRAPEVTFEAHGGERFVTFDDMLALVARDILLKKEWLHDWHHAYAFVQVDEVQDNNLAQWTLVEFLAHDRNILVVGDDQQSIFAFRGARPSLMRDFLNRHTDAKVFKLSHNFRCGEAILVAANGVLSHAEDRLYEGMLVRGRGPEAVGHVHADEHRKPEDEARAVVESIEAAISSERQNPDEVAVLYRLNAQSGPLEIELIKRGIQYKIAGSSFFNRGEIKAAIGYLGVALDATDAEAFKQCYNVPGGRYLGHAFLNTHATWASAKAALASGELGGQRRNWRDGVRDFCIAVDGVKACLEDRGVGDALEFIFDTVGVRDYFRDEGATEEDSTDVDEACKALVTCATTLPSVADLLRYAREMSRTGHEDVGRNEGERTATPRVTLSTVHKAKGLEWERVYVVGVSEGLFPFVKAPVEEERRLGYVAFTRAKDHLHVSWTTEGPGGSTAGPSCLVVEAGLVSAEDLDNDPAAAEDDEEEESDDVRDREELATALDLYGAAVDGSAGASDTVAREMLNGHHGSRREEDDEA